MSPNNRLKRSWRRFRRSARRRSSTCLSVRTGRWTVSTQRVDASVSGAWDLWTSPKKTTDESGFILFFSEDNISVPFSRPLDRPSRARWQRRLTFFPPSLYRILGSRRCRATRTPFYAENLKSRKRVHGDESTEIQPTPPVSVIQNVCVCVFRNDRLSPPRRFLPFFGMNWINQEILLRKAKLALWYV